MSARIRGEHDTRWERWRPSTGRTNATIPRSSIAAAPSDELAATGSAAPQRHAVASATGGPLARGARGGGGRRVSRDGLVCDPALARSRAAAAAGDATSVA